MAIFGRRVYVALRQVLLSMSNAHRQYFFGKEDVAYPEYDQYDQGVRDAVQQNISGLNDADDTRLIRLVEDLFRNHQYYRSAVDPRYHFDVPMEDLERLLNLDGWRYDDCALRRQKR